MPKKNAVTIVFLLYKVRLYLFEENEFIERQIRNVLFPI